MIRRLAGNDPEVNEEWISDKDRFAFRYASPRPAHPPAWSATRTASCRPASWPEAFAVAARGLWRQPARVGVLPAAG